jgi:hypothetical protein
MEQPCYKCGQTVDEGIAFCPHCSAPQIRVVLAEPAPQPQPGVGTGGEASQDSDALPASQTVPVLAVPMRWSQAARACALAALIAVVLSLFSVVLGLLAAGFFAVVFYRRRGPATPMRALEGAKLGALAGILCCCIISSVMALLATVPDARAKMQDDYIENAQKVAGWFPANPDIQASIDQLRTPRGFAKSLIQSCVVFFLLSVALSGVGGTLGAAILGRRDKS